MNTAQQPDLERQRHSLAHVLAYAVKRLYPETKIGIGPATDTGFYYEFDTDHKFTHEDLPEIEEEMQKIIDEDLPFTNIMISREQAQQTLLQLGETYKTELLNNIPDSEVSFYKTGDEFIDLCRGPHVKSTGELENFKLVKIQQSYWLNDTSRPLMQKIVGVSFETRRKLEDYLENIQRLDEINSVLIAENLGLLKLDTTAKTSSPIWLKNGILLTQNIIRYLEERITETESSLVQEPWISSRTGLLEQNFSEFINNKSLKVVVEKNEMVFRNNTESFLISQLLSDIEQNPGQSVYSIGSVFRAFDGELLNASESKPEHLTNFMETTYPVVLTCVKHEDLKELIVSHIRLVGTVLRAFGFSQFKLILEIPDYTDLKQYLYDESVWDQSITILKDIITDLKIPSKIREGGAEFYGPKFTFEVKDKYARSWEISKLTLDMNIFRKLKEGKALSKEYALIHTYLVESIEKLLDLVLEHGEGALPIWVEPEQVEVIPLESKFAHKAVKVVRELKEQNLRVNFDHVITDNAEEKIARAVEKRIPYIIIIGEKEANTDSISVKYNGKDIGLMRVNEFIQKIETEVKETLESL